MNISKKKGNLHFGHPTLVKIEVAQGCTRKCSFCGINTTNYPIGYSPNLMSKELMDIIVDRIPEQTKRIEFELGGEPLLNNNIEYMIEQIRLKFPNTQITILSNTDVLVYLYNSLDFLIRLFDKGLNYYHADIYDKNTGLKFIQLLKENKALLDSNNIKGYNFYAIDYNSWSYHGSNQKEIHLCDEHNLKSRNNKATRKFHNWSGALPLDQYESLHIEMKTVLKKCGEPFKTLSVDYEGNYLLCCTDFSKSVKLGNIKETDILTLWRSELMDKIRWILENGRRDLIGPCNICVNNFFRPGLYYYVGKQYSMTESAKEIKQFTQLTNTQKQTTKIFKENCK